MNISFEQVSKRFAYEWIFRDVNLHIPASQKLAIVGPNGSGKSTFLRILMGTVEPSKGTVRFEAASSEIPSNQVFNHFSMTAPYMDLPDNFTMHEILNFHFNFRNPVNGVSKNDIIEKANLTKSKRKLFRQFSSGMKQRFKLALAILTESDVLILDEPSTNLDDEGKQWFRSMIENYLGKRTLIVASNENYDLEICNETFNLLDFKSKK